MSPGVTVASGPKLFMTVDAVGGVWTYALDLCAALARQGWRVTLAVVGPSPTTEQRAAADAIASLEMINTGLPLDWLAESADGIVAAGRELAAMANGAAADLIHLNTAAFAADAVFSAPLVVVHHSCVATWWAAVRGTAALPDDFRQQTKLTAAGLRGAAAVVVPSAGFASATAATYGLAHLPSVVHNGRAPPPGSPDPGDDHAADVFVAGRLWDEGKNIATLDRAAARVAVPVVAAGALAGPNGAAITLRHAEWLGSLTQAAVRERVARRPIFASVAVYEPFGLAIVEAAQAGCALILADTPTFRELWEDAAVFVPAYDDVTLAAAITGLVDQPSRREALADAARQRAARYSVQAMADGMLAVYGRLAPRLARDVAA